MPENIDALLGFAPDYDSPVPYMQRTREYYKAIGYTTPYRWAHYIDALDTALCQLDQRRLGIRLQPFGFAEA